MKTLVKPENFVFTNHNFTPLCEVTNCGCDNICKRESYADEENEEILF